MAAMKAKKQQQQPAIGMGPSLGGLGSLGEDEEEEEAEDQFGSGGLSSVKTLQSGQGQEDVQFSRRVKKNDTMAAMKAKKQQQQPAIGMGPSLGGLGSLGEDEEEEEAEDDDESASAADTSLRSRINSSGSMPPSSSVPPTSPGSFMMSSLPLDLEEKGVAKEAHLLFLAVAGQNDHVTHAQLIHGLHDFGFSDSAVQQFLLFAKEEIEGQLNCKEFVDALIKSEAYDSALAQL